MTSEERQELICRYEAAAHAMQSGVAARLEVDPNCASPKHLRVGVNSALVDSGAMVSLLVKKGIITDEEILTSLAEEMEEEAKKHAADLSAHCGRKVSLL